jgi:hypothetical protein
MTIHKKIPAPLFSLIVPVLFLCAAALLFGETAEGDFSQESGGAAKPVWRQALAG